MILLRFVAVALLFVNVGRLHEVVLPPGVKFPIAKLLLVLGAIGVISAAAWPRLRNAWRTRPAKGLAVFTLGTIVSLPFSYYRAGSLGEIIQFCFALLPIVAITVASVRAMADLERLFRATALMVVVCAGLLAAGIGVTGETRFSLIGSYDPNDFALVMATCLPFCIWCLRDRQLLWRVIGALGLAGGIVSVVKSGSRGGFVAVAIQTVVMLVVSRQAIPRWLQLSMVPALILGVAFAPSSYRERLQSLSNLSSDYNATQLGGRQAIWTRGATYFLKRPLTGIGIGQFSVAEGRWGEEQGLRSWRWSAPHSMYVESAAEMGILGIGSLLAILWSILQFTRRQAGIGRASGIPEPRRAAAGVALFLATVSFTVGAAFLTAAFSPVFMMLISYAISYHLVISTTRPTLRNDRPVGHGGRNRPRTFRGGMGREHGRSFGAPNGAPVPAGAAAWGSTGHPRG